VRAARFVGVIRRLLLDERVRFVIVGGVNTVVAYALFAVLELATPLGYLASLYLSYAGAIALAFVLHRRFTFEVHGTGRVLVDLLRFVSVYAVALVANTVALPLLVEVAGLDSLVAQAVCVLITTLISYAGHKWFSFRRADAG
jgi:putative flippase GtrA